MGICCCFSKKQASDEPEPMPFPVEQVAQPAGRARNAAGDSYSSLPPLPPSFRGSSHMELWGGDGYGESMLTGNGSSLDIILQYEPSNKHKKRRNKYPSYSGDASLGFVSEANSEPIPDNNYSRTDFRDNLSSPALGSYLLGNRDDPILKQNLRHR